MVTGLEGNLRAIVQFLEKHTINQINHSHLRLRIFVEFRENFRESLILHNCTQIWLQAMRDVALRRGQ